MLDLKELMDVQVYVDDRVIQMCCLEAICRIRLNPTKHKMKILETEVKEKMEPCHHLST